MLLYNPYNIFNLIFCLKRHNLNFTQPFANSLNQYTHSFFIFNLDINSTFELNTTIQGIFCSEIYYITLAHSSTAMDMEKAMRFAYFLDNIFNNSISTNEHISINHLFKLIIRVHISSHFQHTLLSISKQLKLKEIFITFFNLLDILISQQVYVRCVDNFIVIITLIL